MKSNGLLVILFTFIFFSVKCQTIEDFSLSKLSTTYSTGLFTGNDSIAWNYVNARGGQTTSTNNNSAISLNKAVNACIFSDTLPLGIKSLQFQWEQELTTSCNAKVFINDSCIGNLTTSNEVEITKIFSANEIYFTGKVVIKIIQAASNSGQITIDDISFENAEKLYVPFVIQKIQTTDTNACISYSHSLQSAQVTSIPQGLIQSFRISENIIEVNFNNGLCGEYSVTISSVVDTGNAIIRDTNFTVQCIAKPIWKTVIISEIMADPSPQIGLPNYEYIELYNSGECTVNLNQLYVIVDNKKYQLPHYLLHSKTYVFLISEDAKSLIPYNLQACFLSLFPPIVNNNESISLQTLQGDIISHVVYSDSWYGSNFKQNGGWSLEKIDVTNFSENSNNWKAANNYLGGTPGYINSVTNVNIDSQKPEIQTIFPLSDSTILITFSENIQPSIVSQSIHFTDDISITSIESIANSLQTYCISISPKIKKGLTYTCFTTNNFIDIQGNKGAFYENEFALTDSLLKRNSILISEILFNPKSGEYDFVEIYNASNSYYNCANLYIAARDSLENDVKDFVPFSNDFILFSPGEYLVLSENSDFFIKKSNCSSSGKYVTINSMPTLSDNEGTIILLNKWGQTIDSLHYSESWHSKILTNNEGVSLERLHYNSPTQLQTNWFSASTIAGGSTPGCENSQTNKQINQNFSFASDVITPNNDGDSDFLEFSYSLPEHSILMNMQIFTSSGKLVKQIANNELPGSSGIIIWDGTNQNNNRVDSGIYIVFIELLKEGKSIYKDKKTCTVLY